MSLKLACMCLTVIIYTQAMGGNIHYSWWFHWFMVKKDLPLTLLRTIVLLQSENQVYRNYEIRVEVVEDRFCISYFAHIHPAVMITFWAVFSGALHGRSRWPSVEQRAPSCPCVWLCYPKYGYIPLERNKRTQWFTVQRMASGQSSTTKCRLVTEPEGTLQVSIPRVLIVRDTKQSSEGEATNRFNPLPTIRNS